MPKMQLKDSKSINELSAPDELNSDELNGFDSKAEFKKKLINFWLICKRQWLGTLLFLIVFIVLIVNFGYTRVYKYIVNKATGELLNNIILQAKSGQILTLSSDTLIQNLTAEQKNLLGIKSEDKDVKATIVDAQKMIDCLNDDICRGRIIKQPAVSAVAPVSIPQPQELPQELSQELLNPAN